MNNALLKDNLAARAVDSQTRKVFSRSGLIAGLCLSSLVSSYAIPGGVDATIAKNESVMITQQAKRVSGVVTDSAGEPIPGANVVQKETTNGTVTDMNGKYTLDVPNNATLVISFIGYIAENIKFNCNVIYISHDLIKGYGLVKPNRRDYYNAISYLEDENIIKRTNLQNIYVVNPIYKFRGDVNKLIKIISEAKLIKTFDDKDRLIVDKFVLFKNDTDKGIVIANKDLYATEVVDISED